MIPGIACILGSLGWMTVRLSKTGRGSGREPQNTGKVGNTGTLPLVAIQGFHFSRPLPHLRSHNRKSPRHMHRGWQWRLLTMDNQPLTVMVAPDPPQPLWLVGEVLGTGHLPNELAEDMKDRLRTHNEEGGIILESPCVLCWTCPRVWVTLCRNWRK